MYLFSFVDCFHSFGEAWMSGEDCLGGVKTHCRFDSSHWKACWATNELTGQARMSSSSCRGGRRWWFQGRHFAWVRGAEIWLWTRHLGASLVASYRQFLLEETGRFEVDFLFSAVCRLCHDDGAGRTISISRALVLWIETISCCNGAGFCIAVSMVSDDDQKVLGREQSAG